MAADVNRKVVLAKRPEGMPTLECFELVEEPIASPGDGQVVIVGEHLSIDAFIRTTLSELSFHGAVPIGGTLAALGAGRILESTHPEFKPGDGVVAPLGAQTHSLLPVQLVQKVDEKRAPLRSYLGLLGMTTGLTAYFGMRDVGLVREGETVVVSAAAGAVGSVASQIAKIAGARVIGIAGGPDKKRFLEQELGLDAGIDYKGEDVAARLDELAPDGIDVFFDNVGGELLDLVLDRIAERARVVICGAISQYQQEMSTGVRGPQLYLRLAERYSRMEGFTVNHFSERFEEAANDLASWHEQGKLNVHEHIEEGIESFPGALIKLFSGGHTGKLLVSLS